MVLMLLAVIAVAQDPKPPPTIEVTTPNDVNAVLALNTSLSTFSER